MENMNNVPDRELGWDDEIQKDGFDFVLLPEGDYPFEVTKIERGRFAGSAKLPPCNMATLTLHVDGADAGETVITHRLYLHTKTEGLLCAFFESIGLRKHGEPLRMPWNQVVGARGIAKIEIHDYTKKDGTDGESNQVQRFLAPKDESDTAAAPATWTQGAF